MAKRKNRRKRIAQPGDLPTPEGIMQGEAVREFVTHAETATKAMAHRVAHDPVEKWKRKKSLNTVECNTIERMQDIWQAVYGEISLTAGYSEPSGAKSGCAGGLRSQEREISLKAALRAVEDEFPGPLKTYFSIFERICRFGEHPLDVSGDRNKSLTIVKFVANIIAAKGLV